MPAAAVRPLIAIVITALALGGCSTASAPLPSGALAVPIDENLLSSKQAGILCDLAAVIPPVVGVLEGDHSDQAWPVWLQAPDGRRMYVLWPRGFSVRFDPTPTLLDENGSIFLSAGSPVTLGQVGADPAYGTKDRPYVAGGLIETGLGHEEHCYVEKV
jgi:hypothetical protein